jgi:hypothetical protein
MNPAISWLFDQDKVSSQYKEGMIEAMGFVKTTPLNPNQTFSTDYGAVTLDSIGEGAIIPVMTTGKGADKGFEIIEYANKIPVTKLAYDWLNKSQSLAGADSNVKMELQKFADGIKKLRNGAIKRRNQEALQVLTKGLEGTGTVTPNGTQLFAANHPYRQGLKVPLTYRNVLGGAYGTLNDDLNATSLQFALNIQNSELRLGNGDRPEQPEAYKLLVGRPLQTTARSVLNSPKNGRNPYAGTGNNPELRNTFDFDGNRVELMVNPFLGSADNNNETIGTGTTWFLLNADGIRDAKALRVMNLDNGEADMWEDKNTKTMYTSYYESYDMDHYGAESFLVGSLGVA